MLLNPFSPIAFFKISSLKVTVLILLTLLIKTNLLRLKGGFIGGLLALMLISGFIISSSIAAGAIFYSLRMRNKLNTQEDINNTENLETIEA